MENSIRQNGENDEITYKLFTPKDIKKTISQKLNSLKKPSTNKKYKESSFIPKKYSLILVDNRKSAEDKISRSVNNRNYLGPNVPRKYEVKKFELKKAPKKKQI